MPLELKRQTVRDETLTHQVVLFTLGSVVQISCNCRLVRHKTGSYGYDSMGPTANIEESRRLYNDPANHWNEFTGEDEAKW